MGITLKHLAGTDQELEVVSRLDGLILQDPTGQTQQEDMGGTALAADADAINGKTSFGTPFIIETVLNAEETGGATLNYAVFNKDCPYKFKILLAWGVVLDETGTMAGDTCQLFRGDGVASEAFTAITETIDVNVDDDDLFGLVAGTAQYDQDAVVVDENESLRIQLVLANSSNHEISLKVYIMAMRCIASE